MPFRSIVILAALAAGGCVDRRFVIESNVPNAQVYIDKRPAGAAPAYSPFEYYGHYEFTVVHPGYETCVKRMNVKAPWYAYPPFDFLTEVLWPFRIEDTRRYYFELEQAKIIQTEELIGRADALRQRGWDLPAPERPAAPRGGSPTPTPAPLPPPTPAPVVVPEPSPLVPSVSPPGTR